MKTNRSLWVILGVIIVAIFVGNWTGTQRSLFGLSFYSMFDFGGKLFLNALLLLVVPLVSSSIISSIARIGNDSGFRRLGGKTILFFLGTNFLAIFAGFMMVLIFQGPLSESAHRLHPPAEGSSSGFSFGAAGSFDLTQLVLQIVPPNVLDAFSKNSMLGVIFFSLLFGYAVSKLHGEVASILKGFWEGIFQAMIQMTHLIMKFLPLGVFCLVAKQFAVTGLEAVRPLLIFFIVVLLGFLVYCLLFLPILLRSIGRVSPWLHFKAMASALLTAFSTSSSSASLPVTIDCVEKKAKISHRVCSLVIPLGASLNMSGSALYAYVSAIFIAWCYGLSLPLSTQLFALALTLVASIGVAGIPSASLMSIIVVLKGLGLPAEGIALIFAVDRILDMFRTAVNVFSDSCCALLVARTEGEKLYETSRE